MSCEQYDVESTASLRHKGVRLAHELVTYLLGGV